MLHTSVLYRPIESVHHHNVPFGVSRCRGNAEFYWVSTDTEFVSPPTHEQTTLLLVATGHRVPMVPVRTIVTAVMRSSLRKVKSRWGQTSS